MYSRVFQFITHHIQLSYMSVVIKAYFNPTNPTIQSTRYAGRCHSLSLTIPAPVLVLMLTSCSGNPRGRCPLFPYWATPFLDPALFRWFCSLP